VLSNIEICGQNRGQLSYLVKITFVRSKTMFDILHNNKNHFYIDEEGCHAEVTHLCHNRCGQIEKVKGQNVSRLCSYRLSACAMD